MKLHLSLTLRAALLACFSLAGSFVQTVATGGSVAGLVTYSIISQQSYATEFAYDSETAVLKGGLRNSMPANWAQR